MTLRLTPAKLIAAYEYLRSTEPFNRLKLPDPDDLEFRVTSHVDRFGHFDDRDGKYPYPNISISAVHVRTGLMLLETAAHEMVHIARFVSGDRGWESHGPKFKRLAKQVCRVHGFKLETF